MRLLSTSYQPFETFLTDPKEKLEHVKMGNLLTLESGRLLKERFSVSFRPLELIGRCCFSRLTY